VRKGTSPQSLTAIASLIDATVIGSASKGDKDAACTTILKCLPNHTDAASHPAQQNATPAH
jgi:hypothetical protein